MMGKMNLAAMLGVALALAGNAGAQTCTGGIPGVQSTSLDACCVLECGQCGGVGCNPGNSSALTAGDCCATEIVDSGVLCSDTGAAPCILSTAAAPATSTCNNGQTGVQDPDTDVCCPLECGSSCGGDGCGVIPGVDPSQCCAAAIFASGQVCSDTVAPPCFDQTVADGESTCSNGLAGIESQEVCCDAACGVCGGPTCGDVPGLTGAECCVTDIKETGTLCSVTGQAPCVVDPPAVAPSTCPNGIAGYASGNICCAEACGQCGGEGCGAIPGTNGAADCCLVDIAASNVSCGAAPCVMVPGTFTPSPVAAPTMAPGATMAPVATGATIAPSAGSRAIEFTAAPTMDGHTAAPTPGSRAISFTGAPTPAPTSAEMTSAAPTPGSRGITMGPTMFPPDATLPPGVTLPPAFSGSAAATSTGGVVTLAAMACGLFAMFAAARN